jgi:hypothetical protein
MAPREARKDSDAAGVRQQHGTKNAGAGRSVDGGQADFGDRIERPVREPPRACARIRELDRVIRIEQRMFEKIPARLLDPRRKRVAAPEFHCIQPFVAGAQICR